jgi:hypothetical protein
MNWLDEGEFVSAVNALPLVSVDLVVLNAAGQMHAGHAAQCTGASLVVHARWSCS